MLKEDCMSKIMTYQITKPTARGDESVVPSQSKQWRDEREPKWTKQVKYRRTYQGKVAWRGELQYRTLSRLPLHTPVGGNGRSADFAPVRFKIL